VSTTPARTLVAVGPADDLVDAGGRETSRAEPVACGFSSPVASSDLLTAAVCAAIADDPLRRKLHDEIALLDDHNDEVLGRWAAVMLNADVYAEVIDRHVELASDITWLISLLDNSDPPEDHRRRRRAHSSPAVQIEGDIAGEELAKRIVVITQLAEELYRNMLELALRIVPLEWWEARLGATVPRERRTADGASGARGRSSSRGEDGRARYTMPEDPE
jgi:hypothetical protein